MDPSSAQHHHQELSSQTLESMLVSTKPQQENKKPRPQEQALKCPRCDSTNTKFCYYNNYSLTQPRYFCKSCRRYWTKGGTLRNVPVGGGCRKNKRSSSSSKSSSHEIGSINTTGPNNNPLTSFTPLSYDSNDLSLAFASLQKQSNGHLGINENHNIPSGHHFGDHGNFLDALRLNFLENPSGFHQNLYYGGIGNIHGENMGCMENGDMGMHYDQEITSGVTTTAATATTVTTVKQETCNMAGEVDNRVLLGFPWHINGDGNYTGDFDPSRRMWNGVATGPSWHGLLNSPLM